MFSPPAPMMRQYCERDERGTGPVLDEDEGEEVCVTYISLRYVAVLGLIFEQGRFIRFPILNERCKAEKDVRWCSCPPHTHAEGGVCLVWDICSYTVLCSHCCCNTAAVYCCTTAVAM